MRILSIVRACSMNKGFWVLDFWVFTVVCGGPNPKPGNGRKGLGCRVLGFGFRVSASGSKLLGFVSGFETFTYLAKSLTKQLLGFLREEESQS